MELPPFISIARHIFGIKNGGNTLTAVIVL